MQLSQPPFILSTPKRVVRWKTHKLSMFYKMKNGLWPDYIASLEIGALRVKVLSFQKKIKVSTFALKMPQL